MQTKIYRLGMVIMLLAAGAGLGCQTAQKPATAMAMLPQSAVPAATKSQPAGPQQKTAAPTAIPAPTAETKPSSPRQAKPDPAAELIASVEKEYQAGESAFVAGDKDTAKDHFDQAFNLLMNASPQIHADARYQPEYNRVLADENKVELEALQQQASTDTTDAQKSEPAPIDEANEVNNYPVDPNLKEKAAAEIKETHSDLPLMMTDPVAGYINYFSSTRGRETLEHGLERSGLYRAMIERVLKEEGVPEDLIFLAQAESGFHPYAVSRAGARGIWQFMGSRARGYGLHRDTWVDDRQDPEKSTRAAARHLKDLYNQFGDWYLAMAAYNSGPGTIQSAVKRTGYADFWELYRRNVLPRETRNYVPIILAETIMAKNPSQYGLENVIPDPSLSYDTVKIDYPVDLRLVSECVGAPLSDLQELNPSLLRTVTPKGHFELHLPVGTADKYQSAIASVPADMRVWWRYHTVTSGETMMAIARSFHTTAHAIAQANQLEMNTSLEPGANLVIPIAPGRHSSGESQTFSRRLTVYHIRRGDTVESVANNLGIAPVTLRRWNRLKGNSLAGRRLLYVHLPISPGAVKEADALPKSKRPSHLVAGNSNHNVRHTVREGETLYSIASNYNISIEAIKHTNAHKNIATLRPGMVLVIPSAQ